MRRTNWYTGETIPQTHAFRTVWASGRGGLRFVHLTTSGTWYTPVLQHNSWHIKQVPRYCSPNCKNTSIFPLKELSLSLANKALFYLQAICFLLQHFFLILIIYLSAQSLSYIMQDFDLHCIMWDLYLQHVGAHFLTRDQTWATCIGSTES